MEPVFIWRLDDVFLLVLFAGVVFLILLRAGAQVLDWVKRLFINLFKRI